jgi:predicted DNA-binding protein with PD1-like motif
MLAWLDLSKKAYRRIPVTEQAEVLSMIGDIATFDGKPVVHTHVEVGRSDGSTVARHVFELNVTLPRSLCHCGCHASKKKAGRCLRHEDD